MPIIRGPYTRTVWAYMESKKNTEFQNLVALQGPF